MNTQDQIKKTVTENKVVLYMKGTADAPECGFSATAIQILRALELNFTTVDVLVDSNIRQGIKEYANWPTIPQLYINGEFIGGCDIMREMFESGDLKKLAE